MTNQISVSCPYRKVQALLTYQEPGSPPAHCRLEIYRETYEAVVVFSTRKVKGASITHVEELATQVLNEYGLRPDLTRWMVEIGSNYYELELNWVNQRCYSAQWNQIKLWQAKDIKEHAFGSYERRLGLAGTPLISRNF